MLKKIGEWFFYLVYSLCIVFAAFSLVRNFNVNEETKYAIINDTVVDGIAIINKI